ncbi:hypothetical protein PG994_006335 [Apiospora phragmitis]|uniref:Uncharacterized protein n=1 Tax=Apiospora phragmitis TaxID=2905665 RepID=A0ABR1VER7_9PEZI
MGGLEFHVGTGHDTLLTLFGQQFSTTCYAPDGTAASDGSYMPCNFSGGASMCCPTNSTNTNGNSGDPRSGGSRDTCTEGGLCIGQSDGKTRRGYCTDQSWKSSACVDICTNSSAGGSSSGAAILNYCPNEQNVYCCGNGNTTCCGTDFAHTLAGSATVTLSTVVSTAFVTFTPSAGADRGGHQPLSGAAREALSTGGKAGVGIGAGVGGLAVIAVAAALVYSTKRRRQRQKQSEKMDEAERKGSTDEAAAVTAAAAGAGANRRSTSTDDPTSPTKTSELGGRALERTPGELDGEGARFEVPATAITTGGRESRGPSSSWREILSPLQSWRMRVKWALRGRVKRAHYHGRVTQSERLVSSTAVRRDRG